MIELSRRVIYLDLALVFLLLRFSLRTLFFLHLALILAVLSSHYSIFLYRKSFPSAEYRSLGTVGEVSRQLRVLTTPSLPLSTLLFNRRTSIAAAPTCCSQTLTYAPHGMAP
jgi:hypothetical protein